MPIGHKSIAFHIKTQHALRLSNLYDLTDFTDLNQRRSIPSVDFFNHVFPVLANCSWTDEEYFSYFLRAVTLCNQSEDLFLPLTD